MRAFRFSITAFAFLLMAGTLAGCGSPPPRPTYPDIRFTDQPPITLNVHAIDLRENYSAPMRAPNVDHLFPVTPIHAMESWAHDRLMPAGGGNNYAVFIIEKASATETGLAKTQGIKGWFTTDQSERYDMIVSATLTVYDTGNHPLLSTTAQATRSQTVAENISPNDRDRTWYEMTKSIMQDFDRQMTGQIRKDLGTYAR